MTAIESRSEMYLDEFKHQLPDIDESETTDWIRSENLVVSDDLPPGGPVHVAFVADSREQVDAFHRAGIEAGYRDNGAPGVREQYSSEAGGRYYAAFLLDPDGNNVEALYRDVGNAGPSNRQTSVIEYGWAKS